LSLGVRAGEHCDLGCNRTDDYRLRGGMSKDLTAFLEVNIINLCLELATPHISVENKLLLFSAMTGFEPMHIKNDIK
jgi:hypothetical protein